MKPHHRQAVERLPGIYLQQAALRAVAQSASMKILPPTVVSSTSPSPAAPEFHRPQLKLFELATMPEKSTTSSVVPTFANAVVNVENREFVMTHSFAAYLYGPP